MKIYEVYDEYGASICFKPTKEEAEQVCRPGAKIRPVIFTPTKAGIAKLLTDFAGGAH